MNQQLQKHTTDSRGVIVGTGGRGRLPRKKVSLIIGLLVITGVAAYFIIPRSEPGSNNPPDVVQKICSDEVIERASQLLTEEKTQELQTVSDEVQKLPNYNVDPSCLFIVLVYQLNSSDPASARATMEVLFAIPNFETHISSYLKSPTTPRHTRESIRESVEFAETVKEQAKGNALDLGRDE